MLNLLIGPITQLAGTWLDGKVEKTKAETGAKVAKAKAEAVIMERKATGELDWDLEMAKGSQSSWKDEWLTVLFSIPLVEYVQHLNSSGRNNLAHVGHVQPNNRRTSKD